MNNFKIIEKLTDRHVSQLIELHKKMWWSLNRTRDEIDIYCKVSLSFGLIEEATNNLIGYARVLTDTIRYAFIFDVMLNEDYRGKGLGKMLMNAIINHPQLQAIKRFELTCKPDMVEFYEQFGFSQNYGEVVPMRFARE